MGARVSSEERQKRNAVKRTAVQERLAELKETYDEKAVVSYSLADRLIGNAKIQQLQRGGAPFTKADLIAILLCIENKQDSDAVHYRVLSCDDLRSAVRLHIYSVKKKEQPLARHAIEVIEEVQPAPPLAPSAPPLEPGEEGFMVTQ
jgi:hypothetical protein